MGFDKKGAKPTLAILLFICFSLAVNSTTLSVKGKVIDEDTGSPVDLASVFIANTTLGTYSNKKGEFVLTFPKEGVLNLVVSHISYQPYSMNINSDKDSLTLLIKLKVRVYALSNVQISQQDPYRVARFQLFKNLLLGHSKNAADCKILNPSVLHLTGKNPNRPIEELNIAARADSVLLIRNEALGYTIAYNLDYFNLSAGKIAFYGYPLFRDLTVNSLKPKKIEKKRQAAYEGSKLHFFRSLYAHLLEEEGFEIYRVWAHQKDTSNHQEYGLLEDSLFIGKRDIFLEQTTEKLNLYDYLYDDSISGAKKLLIFQPFEVRYINNGEENNYVKHSYYSLGVKRTKNAQVTIVRLVNNYITFYANGSFVKPDELVTIGYWSYKQMADLLPYDYLPMKKE